MTPLRAFSLPLCLLLIASCGDDDVHTDVGSGDAGERDGSSGQDTGNSDSDVPDGAQEGPFDGSVDSAEVDARLTDADLVTDADLEMGIRDAGPFDPGSEPREIIQPIPGEVTIIQLKLRGFLLGEAAILVGPDGTIVLMDVGNSTHDDEVRDLVRELNTMWVTPAHGFPRARGELEVDWVVLSHFHSDHIGGFEDLLTGSSAVEVTQGVVHRGYVDLGEGLTENDYEEVCSLLAGISRLDVPLCHAASMAPCDASRFLGSYPALACDGLLTGDLSSSDDDGAGQPSYIELGGGARMTFVAANGFASDGLSISSIAPFGTSANSQENARSLVSLIEYGDFRYHWGGDLTGSGDPDEPDMESHLVRVSADYFYDQGSDVVHAHHHVRNSSSNRTFVEALVPNDGQSRNVIGGISRGHIGSPQRGPLGRFADGSRLGTGKIWITMNSAGASHAELVDADANVVLQTLSHGRGYRIQAARDVPMSMAFPSIP